MLIITHVGIAVRETIHLRIVAMVHELPATTVPQHRILAMMSVPDIFLLILLLIIPMKY